MAASRWPALLAALHVERSELPVVAYDSGVQDVFVALANQAAVATLKPDLATLTRPPEVAVSAFAGEGAKWKTRMFAPAFGIVEDPATGSAAGPLAVHLARHGRITFGSTIEIEQGAEVARPFGSSHASKAPRSTSRESRLGAER
jgi:trans-2,3-dihydro-3-hydroxyanthranilate isomerase